MIKLQTYDDFWVLDYGLRLATEDLQRKISQRKGDLRALEEKIGLVVDQLEAQRKEVYWREGELRCLKTSATKLLAGLEKDQSALEQVSEIQATTKCPTTQSKLHAQKDGCENE